MPVKNNMLSAAYINMSQYRKLPLITLIRKIAFEGDHLALDELHNHRTVFRYPYMKPLRFTQYVDELRKDLSKRDWLGTNPSEIANRTYDLTVDKFSHLPDTALCVVKKNSPQVKYFGPDCRFYFQALMRKIEYSFQKEKPLDQIKEEVLVAKILQGLVRRHFMLSRLEVDRNMNPWTRYYWQVGGGRQICLWLPVYIKGRERGKWLEKNIDDPDPSRDLERERIQGIIKKKLMSDTIVPLKEECISVHQESASQTEPFEQSLAQVVAKEKAENINQQRSAIRALGKKRLKELIQRIFEELLYKEQRDFTIAIDFSLSKATFSRFAGSRWLNSKNAIPDLWLNTAHVLSTHPVFQEIARETGVWEQVEAAIENSKIKTKEKNNE